MRALQEDGPSFPHGKRCRRSLFIGGLPLLPLLRFALFPCSLSFCCLETVFLHLLQLEELEFAFRELLSTIAKCSGGAFGFSNIEASPPQATARPELAFRVSLFFLPRCFFFFRLIIFTLPHQGGGTIRVSFPMPE